jgi:tetratricopeptide (TPR) repeat protein
MQASRNKYIIFLLISVALWGNNCPVFAQSSQLHLADSLFTIGRYSEAKKIYQKNFEIVEKYNPNMLLKLAYLAEKSSEPAESLFYLSLLAQAKPSIGLLKKMSSIATQYNLTGYQFNDFSYFLIFYRRYGGYIPMLLLTLGLYVVSVMLFKMKKGEAIQKRHLWVTIFYLTALLGLLNIPSNYQTGVVRNEITYIREYPSAASPVLHTIRKGHKLMILGERDHWKRVIWDGHIVFMRKSDLWVI